jgi:hypothetical protein
MPKTLPEIKVPLDICISMYLQHMIQDCENNKRVTYLPLPYNLPLVFDLPQKNICISESSKR